MDKDSREMSATPYFFPQYSPAVPNVYEVHSASRNPAARMRACISDCDGNLPTDAGRYAYADREPEINPPTAGSTRRKYTP